MVNEQGQMQPSLGGWDGQQCSQTASIMVSLAVLEALSRADGAGYDHFLSSCAYF